MLDLFQTDQQDLQSKATGQMAPQVAPSFGQAFQAATEASQRTEGYDAEYRNQRDFVQQKVDAFTTKTGVTIPKLQVGDDANTGGIHFDSSYGDWLQAARDRMQDEAQDRNDPSLMMPSDQDIAVGGLHLARGALQRQAALAQGPTTIGAIAGRAAAGGVGAATDPLNAVSLAVAPEGGPLLMSALRMAGAMAAQTALGDVARFGYRREVDPDYGVGDVAKDVAGAAAGGALFGAGHVLGGEGVRGALGAAAGGAIGGAALGGLSGGGPGAIEGALGGAALPLAGAGLGVGARSLGMSWRALTMAHPDLAADMPLEVRDAGAVAEKAGDVQAQNPYRGPSGEAAHGEAVAKIEDDLINGRAPELPPSAQAEAQVRRGQVFYPGGAIDARYGIAEHADLVTSHDSDFNVRPDYPPELQPRDRSGAPARDQVNVIASDLQPDRLGPSPEANSGAPIVGPDGVVESGNGRVLGIGQAYDQGRAGSYRQWLEGQGFDTTGFDKPVLVGMRETPMDAGQRADFAHAANGSASLRMSATEQALSDARLIAGPMLDLAKSPDLSAAANRDFARAVVAKLPAGERGGMLTREGGLSANGARRMQAAMAARAYGDPGVLARAFDHPDPNIKAIAGALTDAAGPWARMRDAATRGDIEAGHDITGDMLQAVKAVMRARDEGRPAWEVLNQGDMFQSDTTQLAARMFFRDEAMRQPAGRARVAEALSTYAEEAAKNTKVGRLFADDVAPGDVLRRMAAKMFPGQSEDFALASMRRSERDLPASTDQAAQDVAAMGRRGETSEQADIRGIIDLADQPGHNHAVAPVGTTSDWLAETAARHGLDIGGFNHTLDTSAVRHMLKRHGGRDEGSRGGVPLTRDDIAALPEILASPDKVAFGAETPRGNPGISYFKKMPDGSTVVLEELRKGSLAVQSMRKYPATIDVLKDVDLYVRNDSGAPLKVVDVPRGVNLLKPSSTEGDVLGKSRESGRAENDASTTQPDLTLRNAKTGAEVQAQAVTSLGEALKTFDVSRDSDVDPLTRASQLAIGDMLGRIVGDMKVSTVGPAEMRTLGEGRMKMQPGYEPAGLYDPRLHAIVVLDDALRDKSEAARLLFHEGLHGAFFHMLDHNESVRNVVDHLRMTAAAAHLERGGNAADHYGLTSAHEFVSEGFSNPEFQRFLASIPADERTVAAFGLDKAPGHSLWDAFVGAVRKILGLAPDQHTLLDATMRVGRLLEERRADMMRAAEDEHIGGLPEEIAHAVDGGAAQEGIRASAGQGGTGAGSGRDAPGSGGEGGPDGAGGGPATAGTRPAAADDSGAYDLKPALRLADPDARKVAAQEQARKAKAFADVKDAIAYRINSDRIEQHPNGPLAGYLGILTRDIHEKGGINVEAVQQDYEGRMAEASEKILEPYGSKWSGLKQDVAGIRDMISELFGVDTKNETARTAAEAWRAGVDKFATDEAKRLGKVFAPAEDWRVPQFWESSRAQKFGRATLLADMEAEIHNGGLRVFDPDTHEEANPLRMRAILDEAATRIVTDASLGGTHGGAFKTDMRVFRFADGQAGADGYLRLMDKYGAGRGGYLRMMQAHVGKVSRELGLTRVLGPGYTEMGEKLLQDALLADKTIKANRAPRDLAQRVKDLPGDTGKLLTSWLESPAKAEAVWHYMSGQASGVGSELMAGLLSGTRAFMTSTRMGSALVTAVPADTVNWLMAAKHNGMDMGRMVSAIADAFLKDNPEKREEAARLGIVAHAGMDAALGTKRFADQFVGEKLMKRMADFVIRSQGLHAWDSAIKRAFPMEFLGTIAQRAGTAFDQLDKPFANFLDRYGFKAEDWAEMSKPENALDTGGSKYLNPDSLPEAMRVKLMSAVYDERQFAYLAGGSARVRATSAGAKAGTLAGEMARSVFLFKSFPMTMMATWGMRSAHEAAAGRIGTLASLVTGMTFAGALAMQARALLQGKDPRSMKDPYFWGESFLQGGAAGIYGDFFKEAFSRSDTSLTETMMGPLAAIPAGIQGLTSGARRMAEDGEKVNFGAKLSRIISQNTPGGNLWYGRLLASRLLFDNIQRMIDRDYAKSFARQQQRALKTNHQGFFWQPGQNAPGRAPDLGAMLQ